MIRLHTPGKAAVHTHGCLSLHLLFGLPPTCVVDVVHVFVVVQVTGLSLGAMSCWMFALT